jgi:hypothetical protein
MNEYLQYIRSQCGKNTHKEAYEQQKMTLFDVGITPK